MNSICGANCDSCEFGKANGCKGCVGSCGKPFGKQCFVHKYITTGGMENYNVFKSKLIEEINALNIDGLGKIDSLYEMNGSFVNIKYPLPNSKNIDFLDNQEIYLCNQVTCSFNDELIKCFGIVANMDFILVAEYGENCSNPELVLYKKR